MEQHNDFQELPQGERLWQIHDRVTAQRKRLLAAGYLPLPINGKVPPIQGCQDIIATSAIIDRWIDKWPDSTNTDLLTRTTPAIDIDIMQLAGTLRDILRAVRSARRKFGQDEEWEDAAQPPTDLGERDAGDDAKPPPPRGWLEGKTLVGWSSR